jgi:rhodanese-related sulfurtransferase
MCAGWMNLKRSRLDEIPANKKLFIYCEAGLRGYLAQRILRQNGFEKVWNLSGGYILWKGCTEEVKLSETPAALEVAH